LEIPTEPDHRHHFREQVGSVISLFVISVARAHRPKPGKETTMSDQEKQSNEPQTTDGRIVSVRLPIEAFHTLRRIAVTSDKTNADVVAAAIKLYAQTLAAAEEGQQP